MKLRKNVLVRLLILGLYLSVGTYPAKAVEILEGEEWMGIYFKGKKLGFSRTLTSRKGNGFRIDSKFYFRLHSDGADQVTSFTQETELGTDLKLKNFSLLQEIMGNRHQTNGYLEDDVLVMDISSTGFRREKRIPFRSGAVLSSTFGINLVLEGLEVGRKGIRPVFIEALRTFSEMEYEIQGRQKIPYGDAMVNAFVVRNVIAGMESILWIAPDGTVLREFSQDGFESIREPEEKARDIGNEVVSVSSFITMSLVKPQHEIKNPHKVRRMKVELLNLKSRDSILADQRQKVLKIEPFQKGFKVTLKVETERKKIAETRFMEYFADSTMLDDTSEIQSKHPKIKALAVEISSKEKDAWQTAQAINEWVFLNLEKVLVDNFTAMDALNQRKGECQSHTNLFVALARAAGIPSRVISGLVYSNEYKGFLYHAWPEVYVGGWRAMDPTLGQNVVDATHIKLGVGDQQGPLKLMEFIGKIQIHLLEH